MSHKPLWIHQYLYFHKIYKRIVGITFSQVPSRYQKWCNSYFVKIKTFRLQTSKLLGNRRRTYILDVICDKFCFAEVQEEILGQCNRQVIYLNFYNRRSICLSLVCSRKKQTWSLMKHLFKYSTEVRFFLQIREKSKVIANEIP